MKYKYTVYNQVGYNEFSCNNEIVFAPLDAL